MTWLSSLRITSLMPLRLSAKTKNKSFKLTVGYLDKISASESQQELDELLLHTKNFSADSSDDPEDNVKDVVPPPIVGPIAPPPTHERNISTPVIGTSVRYPIPVSVSVFDRIPVSVSVSVSLSVSVSAGLKYQYPYPVSVSLSLYLVSGPKTDTGYGYRRIPISNVLIFI